MKTIYILLILVVVVSVAACRNDFFGQPPLPTGPISFNKSVLPILVTECAKSGCHVPGGQTPDLTAANAYNNLTGLGYATPDDSLNAPQSILMKQINNASKPMPPNGKLTAYDISLITTWIKQGAQNN